MKYSFLIRLKVVEICFPRYKAKLIESLMRRKVQGIQ